MTADELKAHWQLVAARELPDGSMAGIEQLITTWGLLIDVDEWQWRYRFCYPNLFDAFTDLNKLQGWRDVPDGPWVACRPEVRVGSGPDERYPTPAELRALRERTRR